MRSSLQKKLFFIFMSISLIPLVLLSFVGYYTTQHTLTRVARQNLEALAGLQALQFDEFLREKKKFVRAISKKKTPFFQSLASLYRAGFDGKKSIERNTFRSLLRQKKQSGALTGLGISDEKGRLLLTVGSSLPKKLSRFVASQGREAKVVGVLHFLKAHETILRVAVPLYFRSQAKHYLIADFPFLPHQRFLQEHKAPAFRVDVFLLNKDRHLLCGSMKVNHLRRLSHASISIPFLESKKRQLWGKVHRYRSSQGGKTFGIALPMREVNWILLIELSESKVFQPLRELRIKGSFVILLFFLALMVTIALVSSRIVVPLRELLQATKAFGKGRFGTNLSKTSSDEIGELTSAFRDMGQELKSYYTELETKVAERTHELEESQRFSDLLFHAIPEVILVTDRNLRVIKANRRARELFGEDVLGSFCYQVFEGEGASPENCLALQVIKTGEPRSAEDEVPHPHNSELFHKDFYPIFNQKQEVIGVIESAKIITRQKQLLAQVIHQEKIAAVGLLASGVAHEIGNPLASIFAIVQRLQTKSDGSPYQTEYKELEERCIFITQIIETLSDYARKKPDRSVPTNIVAEVEKAIAIVRFDRRLRNVELELEYMPDLPLLWGREGALSQVVTNLLLNALDAVQNAADAYIKIKVWPNRNGVQFNVEDNGQGIEEGGEEKIFEPFFTTKGDSKGTGLGLSICKQIVEQMGGEITVGGREPKGTIFQVMLPSKKAFSLN